MSYIVPTTYHIIVANYATVGKLMEIYFHNGLCLRGFIPPSRIIEEINKPLFFLNEYLIYSTYLDGYIPVQ